MEFMLVLVIVAVLGGVLGCFAGKKWKPTNIYLTEGVFAGMILGGLIAMAMDLSLVYGMSIGMLLGELFGMLIPQKEG